MTASIVVEWDNARLVAESRPMRMLSALAAELAGVSDVIEVLLVHGGGFVPYQIGRFVHGWKMRPEPQIHVKQSPELWFDRLYYDTILHGKPQLEFLVGSVGASRVLLGSDYPYDMGTLDCVRQVEALSIPDADKAAVLGGNAMKLLVAAP